MNILYDYACIYVVVGGEKMIISLNECKEPDLFQLYQFEKGLGAVVVWRRAHHNVDGELDHLKSRYLLFPVRLHQIEHKSLGDLVLFAACCDVTFSFNHFKTVSSTRRYSRCSEIRTNAQTESLKTPRPWCIRFLFYLTTKHGF